ncbi:MAG: glycosyltransferase [Candidatus Omnitrophica bacterium]|nr:glycosyltransferase [Candidatus Omnitrophota bacterium]MBU4478980.1 glycosyltransferase [Candidatus Omnitrophota bacterium]
MRVLNVNALLDPVTGGGMAERTVQMSRQMAKQGIDVIILTTDLELTGSSVEKMEGVEIVALPCINKRYFFPKFSYKAIKNLVREADIIHLTGHWTFINAMVYYAARDLHKPYVIWPGGALPIYGRSGILKNLYNYLVGRKIIRDAARHIAGAQNEFEQFARYGVNENTVSLIPNGIDPADFSLSNRSDFRRRYALEGKPFILFVGRLNSIKGPDLLLQAFIDLTREFGKYHLVFVGPDGGMRAGLEKTTREASLEDKVHFLGYLGGVDKKAAYREADLLVIPSRQDAMPIVALEAGISGTSIVLTDQCGFNEVENIHGGIVVPASAEGIQKGITTALNDTHARNVMAKNLKQYVADNFTWKIIVDKYLTLYRNMLGRDVK